MGDLVLAAIQVQKMSFLWGIPASILGLILAYPWVQTGLSPGSPKGAQTGKQTGSHEQAASVRPGSVSTQRNTLIKPFVEFFDVGETSAGVEIGKSIAEHSEGMELEFLVAVLPDPIDSRFTHLFDSMLDSIGDAIGSQGWNLDHFWLPWDPDGQPPEGHEKLKSTLKRERESEGNDSGSNRAGISDLLKRFQEPTNPSHQADQKAPTPLQELEPGMLVYRKPKTQNENQKLLIALVVGETPTTGVHKKALYKSLNIINSYCTSPKGQPAQTSSKPTDPRSAVKPAPSEKPKPCQFRIIGPTFSGSEGSLSLVISRWIKDGASLRGLAQGQSWHFRVLTGGALKIDRDRFIKNARDGSKQAIVDFRSTVTHIDKVMPALIDFLWRRNGERPLEKVALLTESDTEFGNLIDREKMRKWAERKPAAGDAGHATTAAFASKASQLTQIKFPFHIAQVAAAYDEEGRRLGRNTPSLVRPSSRLTIPFGETGSPRDTVPALSPQMTTATSEFVLSKILETISLEEFRYIGIVATDTRDAVFLAGLIHQYCPDVQVFAPEGDLLFAHPSFSPELRGMILASSYPLFSMVQRWDPPYKGDRRRDLFFRQADQGSFNATLWLLLSGGDDPQDGQSPVLGPSGFNRTADSVLYDALFDYGQPFSNLRDFKHFWDDASGSESIWTSDNTWPRPVKGDERPPIWFSMVGQRGLWPLRFDEVRPDDDGPETPRVSDYVAKAHYTKSLTREEFVGQFIALIPQFTWHWGAVFVALSACGWMLIWVTTRSLGFSLYKREPHGGSLEKLFRLSWGAGSGDRGVATMREIYVLIGWATFMGAYYFFALRPCWIVMRYSPWAVFSRDDLWPYLSEHDKWNWRFSTFAICLGSLTLCIIGLTGIVRLAFFLPSWFQKSTPPARRSLPSRQERFLLSPWLPLIVLALGIGLPYYVFPAYWREHWLGGYASEWGKATEGSGLFSDIGRRLLYFERAVTLNNGVSPLVPILFLAIITGLWLTCQLIRLYYSERFWEVTEEPFEKANRTGPAQEPIELIMMHRARIRALTKDVLVRTEEARMTFFQRRGMLFATGAMFLVLVRLSHRTVASVDFGRDTWWVNFWIWFLALTVLLSLFRFLLLWKAIEDMLRVFTSLPMLEAYGRVPPAFSRRFGRYLGQFRLKRLSLSIPIHQWMVVAGGFDALESRICRATYGKSYGQLPFAGRAQFFRLERSIKGITAGRPLTISAAAAKQIQENFFEDNSPDNDFDSDNVANSQSFQGLRRAAFDCLHILVPYWRSTSVAEQFGDAPDDSNKAVAGKPSRDPLKVWMRALEDLVALRVVAFISQGAVHLRNLGAYLALAPVLLLLAASSYPLQPQRFMIVFLWAILLIVVATGVTVLIQMERNEFLSRVSRTKPNKIAFDPTFFMNVLAFIVPLLVATLAQFPFVSDTVLQWIEPITRVLR